MSHRWLARRKNWQSCGLVFALIISPLRRPGALPAGDLRARQKCLDQLIDCQLMQLRRSPARRSSNSFKPSPPPQPPGLRGLVYYCVIRPCAQTNGVLGAGFRLTVHAWLFHWWRREVRHGHRPSKSSLAADEEQHLKPSNISMVTLAPNSYALLGQRQQICTIIQSTFAKWWISICNLTQKRVAG